MRTRITLVSLALFLLVSCTSTPRNTAVTPSSRSYHGTASVGDFLNITVDSGGQTIAYTNLSNNTSGSVPYTVNPDGTYTLTDPAGNLVAAYEFPNYAMVIQAAKTGPSANTPALITAVESGPISLDTFENHSYNYMQFRTAAGGLEVGSIAVDAQGVGSNSSFWPYGSYNGGNQGQSPFNSGTIDISQAQQDPTGTFLKLPEPNNPGVYDYVFGTASGVFAVDTANGAILGLKQAATKDFDPTVAGTYKAIFYQKTGASTGPGNVETGNASLGESTLVVSSSGQITITDGKGNQMAQASLTPVADTSYLYGSPGELSDPCYGIFTFRIASANSQQDVFVTFLDQSILFASFTAQLPWTGQSTYSYFYGVALK